MDGKIYSVDMDALGNIKIPDELRERFYLSETVSLIVTKDGILIPRNKVTRQEKELKQSIINEVLLTSAHVY